MANRKHIAITLGVSILLIVLLVLYTEQRDQAQELVRDETTGEVVEFDGPLSPEEQTVNINEPINTMNPTAIMTTNKGVIEIELYEDLMPITAGNFISLAEQDFYDGIKFHRVIDGFMIQGGDPNTKEGDESTWGTGGSENIQDEFIDDERLTNTRGSIAMANTGQPNSGSSQFFINLGDNSPLDFNDDRQPASKHPVFGRVINGMDVVDTIANTETKVRDIPVEPIIIEDIEIVRN